MASLYVMIASLALYALVLRASSARDLNPAFSAGTVVLLPFILRTVIWYIYLNEYELPLWQLVSWGDAVVLSAQLLFAYIVFRKLKQNEESLLSWYIWGLAGLAGIYFMVPYIVGFVIPV